MDEWCMVLCRTFHITPEQGRGSLTPIVPHCSGFGPCPGTGHSQCDYSIRVTKYTTVP